MVSGKGQKEQDEILSQYHLLMGGRQLVVVRHSTVWQPPTDVMEEEDRLVVVVEVAGMKQGDFHVSVGSQRLTISGTRPLEKRNCLAYHQLEVRFGEFRTEVVLPWPVDDDGITATYQDGFLRVELPRARQSGLRQIVVNKSQD